MVTLDSHLFESDINQSVMHQALLRQLANARQGSASTKTRTQVSGGGKKPYRQKGTGRARQGSIRAPQYEGGGIVFGPHPRSYAQGMPRKQRRLALRSALSAKAHEHRVVVFESLEMEEPKTRDFAARLDAAQVEGSALIALDTHNLNVEKSARNIPGVKVVLTRNLNVRDLLTYDWLVLTRSAVDHLGEVLA